MNYVTPQTDDQFQEQDKETVSSKDLLVVTRRRKHRRLYKSSNAGWIDTNILTGLSIPSPREHNYVQGAEQG